MAGDDGMKKEEEEEETHVVDKEVVQSWGAVLQEKYVHARQIACCATMDLIAVLTEDRQLIVHRTISWQRMLHVKPSEVHFTMETVVWSPDGMQLAVGCDEGEVVVYDVSTGDSVEVKPQHATTTTDAAMYCHTSGIVTMEWIRLQTSDRDEKWVATPASAMKNRSSQLMGAPLVDSRGAEITAVAHDPSITVLLTADQSQHIGIWWQGRVLVTVINLNDHWNALDHSDTTHIGAELTIESMKATTDLSALFVVVSMNEPLTPHGDAIDSDGDVPLVRHVIRIDLSDLCSVHTEISRVSSVAHEVQTLLGLLRVTAQEMTSEWKSATRVFELKMSLIGSLYEKYDCEVPPQVDMLAAVVGGITSPALAQYFAQDIQEMSIHRMRKMFMTGCDNLQHAIDKKMKRGLQQLLFHVTELRGFFRWKHHEPAGSIGFDAYSLDQLVSCASDAVGDMEKFECTLQETRHDFGLLFSWMLTRVRVHTNAVTRSEPSVTDPTTEGKSLLNERRLCYFLQRAGDAAKRFQKTQSNVHRVEVTFGNQISKYLANPTLLNQVRAMEATWSSAMERMIVSLSSAVQSVRSFGINCGKETLGIRLHDGLIYTKHLRYVERSEFDSDSGSDNSSGGDDDDDDDDAGFDAVDWSSLKCLKEISHSQEHRIDAMYMVLYTRHQIHLLVASNDAFNAEQILMASIDTRAFGDLPVRCADIYRSAGDGSEETLVVSQGDCTNGSLSLLNYSEARYSRFLVARTSKNYAILDLRASTFFELPLAKISRRSLNFAPLAPTCRLDGQASRGIICALCSNSRLMVIDVDDNDIDELEARLAEGEIDSD